MQNRPTKYDLAEYWRLLAKALDNEAKKINPLNETTLEDQKAYLTEKLVLETMLKYGLEVEAAWSPITKKAQGALLEKLAKDHFGNEEIPNIKGPKSLAFAEEVYLPHMKRFRDNVTFHPFIIKLAGLIGVDIIQRQKNVAAQIEALEKAIAKEKMQIVNKVTQKEELKEKIILSSTAITTQFNSASNLTKKQQSQPAKKIDQEMKLIQKNIKLQRRISSPTEYDFSEFAQQEAHISKQQQSSELEEYKAALLTYLNKIFKEIPDLHNSSKGVFLNITRNELEKKDKGLYAHCTLDGIKQAISDIRKLISDHRDEGLKGFIKFTWMRKTATFKEFNQFFDKKNNLRKK